MFLVTMRRSGPEYDHSLPLEGQSAWLDHAAFMDGLVNDAFIVLGGPLEDDRALHAVEAESEDAVRETLARDPWAGSHLEIASIEPWSIRLDGRRTVPRA